MADLEIEASARSPKRPFSAISKNPRRTHPSQSTSLPRSKRVKIDRTLNGSKEQPSIEDTPEFVILPLDKSQESSSDQSARKWFDRVNENVEETREARSQHEGESPFFLAHQSSYNQPAGLRSLNAESFGCRHRTDTENDDLRGVIDDLTVENKKLKLLLKNSHNRGTPARSSPDKVLEIRMHGLLPEKKRELEQLLKTFTLGLTDSTPSQPSSSTPFDTKGNSTTYSGSKGPSAPQESLAVDSGYASVSTSGLNSTSQNGATKTQEPVSQSNRNKNINDYLHDIPNSLLPQESHTLDENAMMRLVVQRLEQLFTGKSAVPGEHSLPLQQQKISRSAARADRREDIKQNRALRDEGSREARILPPDTKVNFDAFEQERQGKRDRSQSGSDSMSETAGSAVARTNSPNQRPTRPLDLDINRAQIVEDNIQYIRHLGFSSPTFDHSPDKKEQPWIYLNLLISMAQLHTLNVTPTFIRKAVKKLSSMLELSKDKHKIRWRGGAEPTTFSPPQGSPGFTARRVSEDAGDDTGRRSRRSATSTLNEQGSMSIWADKPRRSSIVKHLNSTSTSANLQSGRLSHQSKSSVLDYKPIVYHGRSTQPKTSYLDSSSSHGSISPKSSGLVHALSRSSLKSTNDYHEGLVTFFSNPYYCADLSGDGAPINMKQDLHSRSVKILGVCGSQDGGEDSVRDVNACYFTRANYDTEADWEVNCPGLTMPSYPISQAGEEETQPLELPASGIGGVTPEENFALDVKIERSTKTVAAQTKSTRTGPSAPNRQPTKFDYRTIGCEKLALQPSRLPPPSYIFFATSSESSAGGKGYGYDSSSSSPSDGDESLLLADIRWQWTSSSHENQPEDDTESEASSALCALNRSGDVPGQEDENVVSLAATVGASWSAASVADLDDDHEVEEPLSEM